MDYIIFDQGVGIFGKTTSASSLAISSYIVTQCLYVTSNPIVCLGMAASTIRHWKRLPHWSRQGQAGAQVEPKQPPISASACHYCGGECGGGESRRAVARAAATPVQSARSLNCISWGGGAQVERMASWHMASWL